MNHQQQLSATSEWFYVSDGLQRGPVSDAEMQGLIRARVVGAKTLVWRDGMPDWLPVQDSPLAGVWRARPIRSAKDLFEASRHRDWFRAAAFCFVVAIAVLPQYQLFSDETDFDRFRRNACLLAIVAGLFCSPVAGILAASDNLAPLRGRRNRAAMIAFISAVPGVFSFLLITVLNYTVYWNIEMAPYLVFPGLVFGLPLLAAHWTIYSCCKALSTRWRSPSSNFAMNRPE